MPTKVAVPVLPNDNLYKMLLKSQQERQNAPERSLKKKIKKSVVSALNLNEISEMDEPPVSGGKNAIQPLKGVQSSRPLNNFIIKKNASSGKLSREKVDLEKGLK